MFSTNYLVIRDALVVVALEHVVAGAGGVGGVAANLVAMVATVVLAVAPSSIRIY